MTSPTMYQAQCYTMGQKRKKPWHLSSTSLQPGVFFFRGEGVGIDKTNCSAQPNKIKYDQRAQSDKFLFKVFIESYREEGICDLGLGG